MEKPAPENQPITVDQTARQNRAIALEYKDQDSLPKVLASGSGTIADKIVSLAQQHGVPVAENSGLCEMLMKLKPDQSISQETFGLVAQVLTFLYHVDSQWRAEHQFVGKAVGAKTIDPNP